MDQKTRSYQVRFLRYWVRQTNSFVILGRFCPFITLATRKIKILKKKVDKVFWKNTTRVVIFMQMCTRNHDHMIYASWDMECNRHNFLPLLGHFLLFYPTFDPENKNLENETLKILSFCTCGSYMKIIWCIVPEIYRHDRQSFLSFWDIFYRLTLLILKKVKKNIFS